MTANILAFAAVVLSAGAAHGAPLKPMPWDKTGYMAWTIELQVMGGKGVSCATALRYPDQQMQKWVEGFWSGLNVGTGSMVGQHTDNAGMMAEIKLDCDKTPSDNFLQSVHKTWIRLKAAGK